MIDNELWGNVASALNATGITATFVDGIDQSILPLMGNETGLVVANGG